MGACGCSDFNARYRFAGPDGVTYAFEVYRGCYYCGTPVGVVIYRFDAEDAQRWDLVSLPELPFHGYGRDPTDLGGSAEFAQQIIDPDLVIEQLSERFGKAQVTDDNDDDGTDTFDLSEALADEGRELVEMAIDATLKKAEAALEEKP